MLTTIVGGVIGSHSNFMDEVAEVEKGWLHSY